VDSITHNRVVVLSGDTGCGKSTQVPQLILNALVERGEGSEANIVVAQPRRISAIALARRIAEERGERVSCQVPSTPSSPSLSVRKREREHEMVLLISSRYVGW
jgi:HrpA-like RNA helicase